MKTREVQDIIKAVQKEVTKAGGALEATVTGKGTKLRAVFGQQGTDGPRVVRCALLGLSGTGRPDAVQKQILNRLIPSK